MVRQLLISSFLPLLLVVPVAAQTDTTRFDHLWGREYDGPRRLELSAFAGYALSTDWSDLVALHVSDVRGGLHRQVLLRSVAVAPGAGGGAAVTYWRGRHGFRVTGGYSRSCLTTAPRCVNGGASPPESDAALTVAEVPMDIWRYGVEGIIGLRNWADSRWWRPYALLGLGGVAYDPAEGTLPIFPGTFETVVPPGDGSGTVVITNGTDTFLLATDELGFENVLGLTLGIGMDVRVPIGIGGLAVRLELADQMTRSPFSVSVTRLGADGRGFHGDRRDQVVFRSEVIHNLRATAGVALEFGLRGPREEYDPSIRR